MMVKETPEQKAVVERVMREFKEGELTSAGRRVRSPRQAIAIALSEAGTSNQDSPAQQARKLKRTRQNGAGQTRAALYEEAARRGIAGRSRMTKDELAQAVGW